MTTAMIHIYELGLDRGRIRCEHPD